MSCVLPTYVHRWPQHNVFDFSQLKSAGADLPYRGWGVFRAEGVLSRRERGRGGGANFRDFTVVLRMLEARPPHAYIGMPKNTRGAARPYPLKVANNSMATVCTARDRHVDMAALILFLAAKRFEFPAFFTAAA